MSNGWTSIPNLFSEFRILAAPFLLLLAWYGHENWFLALLALAFLTDAVDGFLARALHQTSELGAQLDSWGDMITFLTIPICIWWLWPDILVSEATFIILVLIAYITPLIIGYIKFRQLPSYHTWASKTAAVMMTVSIFVLLIFDHAWPFRIFAIAQFIVAAEEIAITLALDYLRSDIRSYWHAKSRIDQQKKQI